MAGGPASGQSYCCLNGPARLFPRGWGDEGSGLFSPSERHGETESFAFEARRHPARGWAVPCGAAVFITAAFCLPWRLSEPRRSRSGDPSKEVCRENSPTMHVVNSSDTAWLLNLNCSRPVREHDQQMPWQAAPDESQDIIASIQCILDRENSFVREVDRYLRHNDFLNLRKKEMLYKKWLEDVSEPLLQKIEDKMDQSIEEIRKRREEQLSLYLNHCKKKGYVTLETYDPSEYDPLFLKMCTDCWKVSVPAVQDPLLEGIQRRFIETGIIKQCETGKPYSTRELNKLSRAELPLLPLSRQRMDAVEWLKIPYTYIDSDVYKNNRAESHEPPQRQ